MFPIFHEKNVHLHVFSLHEGYKSVSKMNKFIVILTTMMQEIVARILFTGWKHFYSVLKVVYRRYFSASIIVTSFILKSQCTIFASIFVQKNVQ